MKNLIFLLLFVSPYLTGCSKFADGTSVWSEGLWIIPVLTSLGAVWFGYKAYKDHNSGSFKIGPGGERTNQEGGNVPYTKIGWTWFSLGLAVIAIAIIIYQNGQK